MKLEKGNMATDWSPAPEDITANYYTKTETNSQIIQKADEISSVVSQSISAVQVGGTNLIKNSAPYNLEGWTNYGATTSLVDESTAAFKKAIKVHFSDTTQTGAFKSTENRLEVGKEYSWSVYVKSSKNTELTIGQEQGGTKVVNLTTSWQKFTYTFTADNEPHNNFIFYCYSDARQNGLDVYIHSLKLEEGNKITSWSINPNDEVTEYNVISKINQSAEQIEIGANKINILGKKVKFTTNIDGNYTFSQSDLDKIVAYIMGEGTLTSSEKELYDINKDGMVRATDYTKIRNAINNNNGTINITGTFEIDPDSAKRSLILRDSSGNIITSVGLLGMQTQSLGAERIESIDATFQNLTVEGTFTNNSDKRLKTDIVELDNKYTNLIKDIDPVIFTYKKSNQRHIGFIAQDVEQAFNKEHIEPTLVKKDDLGIYSLDYIQLIGILWKDNKIKNELIENLQSRIEKLEKK